MSGSQSSLYSFFGGGGDDDGGPVTLSRSSGPGLSPQSSFVEQVKDAIKEAYVIPHTKAAERAIHLAAGKKFPFPSVYIQPQDAYFHCSSSMLGKEGVSSFYLKPVLAFFPEYFLPAHFPKGRVPCIVCKSTDNVEHLAYQHKHLIDFKGATVLFKR
jgi:hypothetical protein